MGSSQLLQELESSHPLKRLCQSLKTLTFGTHLSDGLGQGIQLSNMSPLSTGTAGLLSLSYGAMTRKRESESLRLS